MKPSRPHFLGPQAALLDLIAVGPWDCGEFATLRSRLNPDLRWPHLPTLEAAILHIENCDKPPELVLLAQPRPTAGAAQALIEQLRIKSPLTRVVVVAGSWCEGELRTGRPLTGVVRLYWYEFSAWWQTAVNQIALGEAPPWSDPMDDIRTGQKTRRRRLQDQPSDASALVGEIVAIDSVDYSVYESLHDLLSPFGCKCIWQPRFRPARCADAPTIGMFDGSQLDATELEQLEHFTNKLELSAPILLLLDFPRPEHFIIARAAGATSILAKPYQTEWLVWELLTLSGKRVEHRSVVTMT